VFLGSRISLLENGLIDPKCPNVHKLIVSHPGTHHIFSISTNGESSPAVISRGTVMNLARRHYEAESGAG
jgi:hypothetical protein